MAAGEKYLTYGEMSNLKNNEIKHLYFAQDVGYTPSYGDFCNLYCRQFDNLETIYDVQKTLNSAQGYYNIVIRLQNQVLQNRTTGNAYYPTCTPLYTYSQLNNANKASAVGYSKDLVINPSYGYLKANDFIIISGSTEISLANKLAPKPTSFTIYTRKINSIEISAGGRTVSISNLKMILTTNAGSVTWNLGTASGTGTELTRSNISASTSSISCNYSYSPRISFTGYVCGQSVAPYPYYIYISEFTSNHFDTITAGNSYGTVYIGPTETVPYETYLERLSVDFTDFS